MPRASDPDRARQAATEIVTTLRGAGHVAYFAGGCVRDELLGLRPTDYDVATDATPDRIRTLFRRTDEVGASFGVVLVTLPTGGGTKATVEVATFRSDGPYTDRRRPDAVTFSDERSDALRRDYTINALFLDPLAPPDEAAGVAAAPRGRVIDHVGGLGDVRARVLRAVGDPDRRLAEDHLRALRAVRLAARLDLTIEPATAAAIARHAGELRGVSRERIGDELRRIMAHPSRGRAIELLTRFGLDAPVLEGAHASPPTRGVLAALPADASFAACLAAWALERGEESRPDLPRAWTEALCLSNEEKSALAATLDRLAILRGSWSGLGVARQKRLAVSEGFDDALTLLRIVDPPHGKSIRDRVAELAATPGGLDPEPLIDGEDLIDLGLKPGPTFRRILDGAYDAQLEGRVVTRAQALNLARELARNQGV